MADEKDITKYPFLTASGLDLVTKEFYELKGIPMSFWMLGETIRVGLEVWQSESAFANSEKSMDAWRWSYELTDEDKTKHSKTLASLENGALNWLKVGSDYQIRTLGINLTQCVINSTVFEIARPKVSKFGETDEASETDNFDKVIAENPDLVTAYSTLIWTLAKENNPVFQHFN